MLKGLLKTLLFLMLIPGMAAAEAETIYVHDQLRLGVRAAPNASEKSIAVVKTGDALTVLGEQGDFIKIRTESGVEGWVIKSYVSTEPPAQNRLAKLKKEYQVLQRQHATLEQQLDEKSKQLEQQLAERAKQSEQQQQELNQLQQQNGVLREQLGLNEDKAPGVIERYRFLIGLGLLLACFLAGWIIGVRWKARQVAERIGGLQI